MRKSRGKAAPKRHFIPILNQSAIFVSSAAQQGTPANAWALPGVSSASSTYVQYTSSPPSCRFNIIFDLEMVLNPCCKFAINNLFFLPRHDRFYGTLIGTGSTVVTKFGIYNILVFTFRNCFHWTLILTRAASNAFISNYIRHFP